MGLVKGIFKLIGYIIKIVFEMVIFLIFLGICIFIYARYIEPQLLIVHNETINAPRIKGITKPIKIVQFSDTHLGEGYTLKNLRRIIEKINETKPDIIVFSGDLIDDNTNYGDDKEAIIKELNTLKANLCKVAVYGNHDHGGNGTKRYKKIMEASGFILLNNTHYEVKLSNGQKINIMGIDDLLLGTPNIEKTMKTIKTNDYNLFISHAPDVADDVKAYPIDLQLSGHSHGGQIAIPFMGAPLTPPYAKKYIKGMHAISGNERMKLYVNCGTGTSQVRYRFFNIPEITVFTLKPQSYN